MTQAAIKYTRNMLHVFAILVTGGMFGIAMQADNKVAFWVFLGVFASVTVHSLTSAAERAHAEAQTEAARLLLNSLLSGQDTNINVTVETREGKP